MVQRFPGTDTTEYRLVQILSAFFLQIKISEYKKQKSQKAVATIFLIGIGPLTLKFIIITALRLIFST